jgi:asparagine synthase (glutamine-hydrolysing)
LRAIGALDYAFLHPLGRQLPHHMRLTASLSGESYARILFKVLKHGYLRAALPSAYLPKDQPHLLSADALAATSPDYFRHPWVDAAHALCPGKHNHVLGVATSVPYYDCAHNREKVAPSVHPLAAQPVIETCLRIPTYVLLANGVSRGLARRAFADLLPAEITRRTTKGLPMTLWQNILRRNLRFARERLLDGLLVKEKLLDRDRLDRYLVDEQPYLTVHPQQIMGYLACEAWLAQLPAAHLHAS